MSWQCGSSAKATAYQVQGPKRPKTNKQKNLKILLKSAYDIILAIFFFKFWEVVWGGSSRR
jgi:hypothetical protein